MNLRLLLSLLPLTYMLLSSCGGNRESQGDSEYADGNYDQALAHYQEVKKSSPQDANINEKIALTYMQRGLKLYQQRKNIDAFTSNFEKGQAVVPKENVSDDFKTAYSKLLTRIAQAYQTTTPKNEIQRELFFNKTIQSLEEALNNDPNNTEADEILAKIKSENFQKMYDRGCKFLEQGLKERTNHDLFLSAERYLTRAVSFDPNNQEALATLSNVRKKTLSIINMDMDFPIAIADYKVVSGHVMLDITGINNSGANLVFDPAKLKLVDLDENEYRFDKAETDKFEQGLTKTVELAPRKQIDGPIAFAIPGGTKIKSLEYELDEDRLVKKYFP
jgi:tetratricopeptide (TPR) repeat protein